MTTRLAIRIVAALLGCTLLSCGAWAQVVLPKPRPQPKAVAPLPDEQPEPGADMAFYAFQRGLYLTALLRATKQVEQKRDPKSMTLLGELYAEGLGVPRNDQKAAEWYKLAAERGDREAMFALAMFRIGGRGGPKDRDEAARLLASAAKLGHAAAAYDLALLYLEGQLFPRDFKRAAELFRVAAEAGSPEAQYALAICYKEGQGVTKDVREAARLLGAAALAWNTDAEIEYGIALFNGTGAARKGNPIAQNRLAFMYATGRGVKADPVQAARWHMIAKAGGSGDAFLEDFVRRMRSEDRAAAEKSARPWLSALTATPSAQVP
jgi:TPR repeat protein